MFKKNAWIAGLLTVLVMMFFGCIDAAVEDDDPVVEVARLSKIIADVEVGPVNDDTLWGEIFKGTPFDKCGGSADFSIIEEKGVKKLQISKMDQTWGQGLDIRNANFETRTGLNFRSGDVITIKGWTDHAGLYMNLKGGAHGDSDNWKSPGEDFDHTLTLTAAMVGTIRTGSPQVIRLHYHSDAPGGRQGTFKFEEIVVTGKRGGTTDVFEDDFEYSNRLQTLNWLSGITITPKTGKTTGEKTIWYKAEADDPDVAANWTKNLDDINVLGVYDVKFDVAAAKGFNAAKGLTGGQIKVLTSTPDPITDKVFDNAPNSFTATKVYKYNGGAWDNAYPYTAAQDAYITGPDGASDWVLVEHNNIVAAAGDALPNTVTPMAIRNHVVRGVTRYCVRFRDNWASYEEITIVADLIATSIPCTTANQHPGKECFILRANNGGPSGLGAWSQGDIGAYLYKSDGSREDSKNSYPEVTAGSNIKFTFKTADIAAAGTPNGVMFGKNHGGATLMKIKEVRYHYAD